MALNNLGLGFTFTAKDLATPTMNRVEGRFRRLDKTTGATSAQLQQGFGALRASGLAIGLAGGLALRSMKGAADAAGKFEQSIAKVGAISRAPGKSLRTEYA